MAGILQNNNSVSFFLSLSLDRANYVLDRLLLLSLNLPKCALSLPKGSLSLSLYKNQDFM